jgi:bifunctional UDP-N-acetylglucosamine pyrophosphorylase/glucosamine-1-phosphate N-acetyltransferase
LDKAVAVILAAGEGKRMKSDKPKVLQEVLFKPMIDWVVDSAVGSEIGGICVVVGNSGDKIVTHLEERGVKFATACQNMPLGTGHAVMQAVDYIRQSEAEDVLVLYGDAPFIGSGIIKSSYFEHKNSENYVTVMSAETDNPTGYGRIVRDGGDVVGIVEEKDATPEQKKIREINAGAYWFKADVLIEALSKISNRNVQNEYYLTDTVAIIGSRGFKGGSCLLDMKYIAGANDQKQLYELNGIARGFVFDKLFENGVSVVDDSGIIIGPDVKIGRGTVILPGTIIKGETKIGNGCTIGPNSVIDSCSIGDNVIFNASQAQKSLVESGVTIGPFANIRPNCHLHENVHVGDFVEVKNSEIGVGTKVGHLTYVGDSDVGSGVNFGCGVVTGNYDGVKKSRTTIGDNAFIGCNTNLVAPVKVGDGAYTAAGSTVTRDVPDGALAVARSRQENLEGWVARRRKKK